jgi:hypothetical protein
MLDLVDAYTLVLHGIPLEEIPVSEHYAAIIKRFRPFEARNESAEEISRISRLRKSYVLKLKKAYKDNANGFPFGINVPGINLSKSKRRPRKKQPEKIVKPIWRNQIYLSKRLDLSIVTLDERLIEVGLKDPVTEQATQKAINDDYAKIVYKRKRGKKANRQENIVAYFVWNVDKVLPLLMR